MHKNYKKYINQLALLAIILQILDGLFTYIGVKLFGSIVEGNPLIRTAIELLGVEVALISIKLFACFAIFYLQSLKTNRIFYMFVFINFVYMNVVLLWAYQFCLNFMYLRNLLNF